MAQPLDVLIDNLIEAWYKQHHIPRHHDIQDLVNHIYMNFDTSGNIKAYNSRRSFLELVHIPTDDDVSDWCFGHCAAKWVSNPSGGFRHIFNEPGQPPVVSPEELRRDYIFQKADLKFHIWQFLASEEGYVNLHHSSMNRRLTAQVRMDEIMVLRRHFGIPTKTKVTAAADGRITKIEYDAPKGPFNEQVIRAIRGSD